MMRAFCDRRGVIEFEQKVPSGMIELASHEDASALRSEMCAAARHAYDGRTLLVPGVPEAETDAEAHAAVQHFQAWLAHRRRRPVGSAA